MSATTSARRYMSASAGSCGCPTRRSHWSRPHRHTRFPLKWPRTKVSKAVCPDGHRPKSRRPPKKGPHQLCRHPACPPAGHRGHRELVTARAAGPDRPLAEPSSTTQHLGDLRCKAWAVDDHQRRMWSAMLDLIGTHRAGRLDLGALVEGLRGLYTEADPHDAGSRDQFEAMWSPLDAEYELRTEPWAPARSASDDALGVALSALTVWVTAVLAADSTPEHE